MTERTPSEIVSELDRHIIGQQDAKRAVAIAIRNRWRRRQLSGELRQEIMPKNLILIGSTGVGKTEIARRVSKLVGAPFLKVEASKYTEVGYYGRDVESMIRDLAEISLALVKAEAMEKVESQTTTHVEDRLLELLVGPELGPGAENDERERRQKTREAFRKMLDKGELEEREVEISMPKSGGQPLANIFGGASGGLDQMGVDLQELMSRVGGSQDRSTSKRMTVADAREALAGQEAEKLIDLDKVQQSAISRAEQSGIIFLDEIDKVVSGSEQQGQGQAVSREGVQRDLLPIVEGSTVNTRYGPLNTDHILFIGAGAFHQAKPSDLIPELQGRFPIRVELASLTKEDFGKILREPDHALPHQYHALLATEGVEISFEEDGLDRLAELAWDLNQQQQNIGARRLYAIFEKLLEEPLYLAPDALPAAGKHYTIDKSYVDTRLGHLLEDPDQRAYIL